MRHQFLHSEHQADNTGRGGGGVGGWGGAGSSYYRLALIQCDFHVVAYQGLVVSRICLFLPP